MFRIEPAGPVHLYQTFAIRGHQRQATCAEYGCEYQARGWVVRADESTDLGRAQAHYIRYESRRRFHEERLPGGLTAFRFEAGQQCFTKHYVQSDREPLYVVRGGDHRGNPTGRRGVYREGEWVDRFGTHQQDVAERVARG
jgi:hypothetical protein